MSDQYKWDVEALTDHIEYLENLKTEMLNNQETIKNLKQDINVIWNSIAGENFKKSLDIDIEFYKKVIDELDSQIKKLKKAVNKVYATHEDTIRVKLNQMCSHIS